MSGAAVSSHSRQASWGKVVLVDGDSEPVFGRVGGAGGKKGLFGGRGSAHSKVPRNAASGRAVLAPLSQQGVPPSGRLVDGKDPKQPHLEMKGGAAGSGSSGPSSVSSRMSGARSVGGTL